MSISKAAIIFLIVVGSITLLAVSRYRKRVAWIDSITIKTNFVSTNANAVLAEVQHEIERLEYITKSNEVLRTQRHQRIRKDAVDFARIGFIYHAVGKSWDDTSNAVWVSLTTVYEIKE